MTIIERARIFACAAHGAVNQVRRYTGEPYYNHTRAVADIVAAVPGATDSMIAAAHLHDVVEDTGITIDTIRQEFGNEVAELLEWLTDISKPQDGNRATRKAIDCAHIAAASAAAQTIKLADIIDNCKSIKQHNANFAVVYFKEKQQQFRVLTRGDSKLREIAIALLGD